MRRTRAISIHLVLSLLCAWTPAPGLAQEDGEALERARRSSERFRRHVVQVDTQGRLQTALGSDMSTADAEVALREIFDGFARYRAAGGPPRILIFVHGGLNSEASTLARVDGFSDAIQASGYYPIFVSWESGLVSSYWEHVLYIRQGQRLRSVSAIATAPFVFASDLVRAVARAPLVWGAQVVNVNPALRSAVLRVPDWQAAEDELEDTYARTLSSPVVHDVGHGDGIAYEARSDRRTSATRVGQATVRAASLVTQLLSAPVIDAFGKRAWEILQRRVQLLFHRDRRGEPGGLALVLDRLRLEAANAEPAAGSAAREAKRDGAAEAASGEAPAWEIALVGHSMGAIVVNQILREYGDLPIRDVVYMAAACSVRDYEDSVVPFLRDQRERGQRPRIYHLTLHEKAEIREGVGQLFIEGSLLVWIDDFLATPLTERDRTAGRFENVVESVLRSTPKDFRGQVHLKKFGVADGGPERHGDFSGAGFWCRERWEPAGDRALHADLESGARGAGEDPEQASTGLACSDLR